jgi:hypothetical protein
MIKLRQKIYGCMRNLAGAEQYLATARKHGVHFLDALVRLAEGRPRLPTTDHPIAILDLFRNTAEDCTLTAAA